MIDDIVTRLRKEISKRDRPYPVELLPELRDAADKIDALTATIREFRKVQVERDEARRRVCHLTAAIRRLISDADVSGADVSGRDIADELQWDCFVVRNTSQ